MSGMTAGLMKTDPGLDALPEAARDAIAQHLRSICEHFGDTAKTGVGITLVIRNFAKGDPAPLLLTNDDGGAVVELIRRRFQLRR